MTLTDLPLAPTHLGVSPGKALCAKMDPASWSAMPGEWLTKDAEDVDCRDCIEWMHA